MTRAAHALSHRQAVLAIKVGVVQDRWEGKDLK